MSYANKTKEQLIEEIRLLQSQNSLLKNKCDNLESRTEDVLPFIKKMISISKEFIKFSSEAPDYEMILSVMHDISGAKYSALNIFEKETKSFTTHSICGVKHSILEASNILGYNLIGKKWDYDPNKERLTEAKIITEFSVLTEMTGEVIPKYIVNSLIKLFSIGKSYIVRITKEDKLIGDITLFFETGREMKNSNLVELYSSQIGLFLDRNSIICQLLNSEKLYRNLVEKILDGVYKSSHEGRFIEVNQAMVSILGYDSKEELLAIDINKDLYFQEEERFTPSILDKQKNLDIYRLKKKDGTEAWVEDHGWYIYDDSGNIVFHEGVIRDITDRKYAEDSLIISEERYRLFIDSTKDMVFLKDENFKYLIVNKALAEYSGVKMEEMIGKTDFDFKKKEEAENIQVSDNQVIKTDYIVNFEDISGDKIYDIRKFRIPFRDGKFGIGGYIRDITENKRKAEKLIELTNELKQMNATKDKFFSIIAHDLKSPFTTIYGFSRILADQVRKKDIDQVEKFAEIIMNSSQRAVNLLGNLMEWSQSQIGQLKINFEVFNVYNIVEEIILLYSDAASQKSITLFNRVDSEIVLKADKAMINTVLRNLISNAIKFSNSGDEVVISAKLLENEVLFEISDTGLGISEDRITKVFKLNESISTAGTQNEQGSGLGLILCKEFIEKHNGRIWVESELGKGSKFLFTISR